MVSEQACPCHHEVDESMRAARLNFRIYRTSEFKQYCHVGNTAQQ